MLCQNCQKRVANVHFTQLIGNKKVEMYLCEQCAREKGHMTFMSPVSINDFLAGFINLDTVPHLTSEPRRTTCEVCGASYEEFQSSGKIGCGNCYEIFGDKLDPILRRLHGNVEHSGKVPAKLSAGLKASKEIEKLRILLNKAVQNEEYEKAAEIRDRIKAIESGS